MLELGLSVLATIAIAFLLPGVRLGLARLAQWRADRRQRWSKLLHELIETELNARERRVIALRFGLYDESKMWTLQEIGQRLGVSSQRVRQIEANAFSKLQAGFAAKGIGPEQAMGMLPKS